MVFLQCRRPNSKLVRGTLSFLGLLTKLGCSQNVDQIASSAHARTALLHSIRKEHKPRDCTLVTGPVLALLHEPGALLAIKKEKP